METARCGQPLNYGEKVWAPSPGASDTCPYGGALQKRLGDSGERDGMYVQEKKLQTSENRKCRSFRKAPVYLAPKRLGNAAAVADGPEDVS